MLRRSVLIAALAPLLPKAAPRVILLRAGTYRLNAPLVIGPGVILLTSGALPAPLKAGMRYHVVVDAKAA